MRRLLLALLVCAAMTGASRAQFIVTSTPAVPASNPISAARLPMNTSVVPNTYWANYAGVEGGIPSGSYTQCTNSQCNTVTSAGTSATAAQITSALANAPNDTYVLLTTGTYNLSDGIDFSANNRVALRGAGPNATFLIFSDHTSCLGAQAVICMKGGGLSYYVGEGTTPAHVVNWTAGYANGDTQVTLANTTGLAVGNFFVLDQLPDQSDGGALFNCGKQYTGAAGTCSDEGGGGSVLGRGCNIGEDLNCRSQHQWVKVVSCSPSCNNGSSTVVTIDHPLHLPNWSSGKTPQAYWGSSPSQIVEYNGVEELSVEGQAVTANGGMINAVYVANSWIKHVRMLYAPTPKAFVILYGSSRMTIRDSYGFGTADESGSSTHYGIEDYGGNDNLIENNIFDHRTGPYIRDGTTGSVYAYNFAIDNYYDAGGGTPADDTFMQADQYSHAAGNMAILVEGNSAVSIKGDIVHGTSNLFTILRNYAIGWEDCDACSGGQKTNETVPLNLYAYNRYWNVVCNVFGKSGYHSSYSSTGGNTVIYRLGASANAVPTDSLVSSTLMRWGNWDVFTSSADTSDNDQTGTKWDTSEVPDGLGVLPNADPSSNTCPTSLYLSAKPSFMGSSDPWPGIGPDVTGSQTGSYGVTGVGGHVYKNPAQRCYESMAVDTNYSTGSSGGRPRQFTCNYPL